VTVQQENLEHTHRNQPKKWV